jgi:NADH-quinone oxidoreductase subunit M
MGISLFASVGLPGLNGFVSEFLIFKGVFAASPWAAAVALVGLLGTAVFLLTILQKLFHGPLDERAWGGFPDLTWAERAQLAVPVALMLAIGVFPGMILRLTNTTILNWAGGN